MLPLFLSLLTASFLAASIVHFGRRRPGYNHARDTISELGERGAKDEIWVAYGLFMPTGTLLLFIAWLVIAVDPRLALLALCIAVGYFAAAAFPCDPGSPAWGGLRQLMHNLGGAVQYAGGAYTLNTLSQVHGEFFRIAMFVTIAGLIGISVPAFGAVRGLVQRLTEAILFGSLSWGLWLLSSQQS